MSRESRVIDHPYRKSYGILGEQSQSAIGSALLKGLGLAPTPIVSIEGKSGIEHKFTVSGVDAQSKRFVILQTGAGDLSRIYTSSGSPSRYYGYTFGNRTSGQEEVKSPEQQRLEWLQKSLFVAYDVRAALEARGWTCDMIFFFNSFLTPIAGMNESDKLKWFGDAALPKDMRTIAIGSSHRPVEDLDVSWIQEKVTSTGAAFIDAQDLSIEEISILAGCRGAELIAGTARDVVSRTRLEQFFKPPLDELLLGTIDKAKSLSESELIRARQIASDNQHEICPNSIAQSASHQDPLETLKSLREMRYVGYSRREIFLEPSGKAVVQEWQKTPEESLFIKILRELRLPDLVEAVIKGFSGAGS